MKGWRVQIRLLATLCAVVLWIGCDNSTDVVRSSSELNQRSEPIASSVPDPPQPESTQAAAEETSAASEKDLPVSPPTAIAADEPALMETTLAVAASVDTGGEASESDLKAVVTHDAQIESADNATSANDAAASEPAVRLLLPTTSGPLVVDVEIFIGDQPLQVAFDTRIDAVMEEAGGDSSDLTWTGLFEHVAADPQQFGRSSTINSQQYRDLVRRYDRNRNKKPDHDEVAKFLFRNAGFAGPFRIAGSNSYRELNRSQSAVFAALDRNDNRVLDPDEVDRTGESLRRLDQNADERLDVTEIVSVAADDNPAWKNRSSSRWGEVAMDLSGYLDWSMLSYSLDDMPRHGPFGRRLNAIEMLDQDHSDSIDRDEARELLSVAADILLRVRYPRAASGEAELKILSVCPDLEPLVELTEATNQTSITGSSLRLTATISDVLSARNQIPPQAFAMLDANNDGGLDKSEIPAAALREYSFEDLDQDGDDKLTLREINEGMSPKSPIWNVQVRARGAETPDGVFAWLDQNQDQFLSTREINGAEARLRASASSDGSVKPSDIPDSYLVQFVRGDPDRNQQLFALTPPESGVVSPSSSWPRWAQAMDTNRDGEISRGEFPGTSQQFDQLDKNADGFIDIDEVSLDHLINRQVSIIDFEHQDS